MTTPPAAPAPQRTRLRRYAPDVVIVAAGVIVALLVAWMLVPYLSFPSSRLVGWELPGGLGAPGVDSSAQTTSVIPVSVDWPPCAPMWTTGQNDDSWLGTPAITYTPWSVTITMHTSDTFSETTKCDGARYFSGLYVPVPLSEPLGGRALFDGSKFPPAARPYP